jgi:hypothetical protein
MLKVEFSEADWQRVMAALSLAPYREIAAVLQSMMMQLQAQRQDQQTNQDKKDAV